MTLGDADDPESVLAAECDWSDMARAQALALTARAQGVATEAVRARAESRDLLRDSQRARSARTRQRVESEPAPRPVAPRTRVPISEPPHPETLPGSPIDYLTPPASFALTDLSVDQIWIKYAELGGDRGPAAVGDYLAGTTQWPAMEVNILAHVLNEHFLDVGLPPLAGYRS